MEGIKLGPIRAATLSCQHRVVKVCINFLFLVSVCIPTLFLVYPDLCSLYLVIYKNLGYFKKNCGV